MTSDDPSEKYLDIYNYWQNLPNLAPPSQELIDQKIEEFKIVESQIMEANLISPNEDFEEILPENLKFQLMPMILADFYTRKHQKRLEFLNKAEFQYHQYLKLELVQQ